jgi:glycosyltransferase 2 family protein
MPPLSIETAPPERARTYGTLGQRVALAASLWVAASLAVAFATLWWQAQQVGGLAGFNLVLLYPAAAFALISAALRALRWHGFLAAVGARPSLLTSIHAQLIGFSLTMTPGKVGEVYKCHLIEQRTGVPMMRTAPIVLFEKAMDAVAFGTLAVIAAALLPGLADSVGAAARTLIVLGVLLAAGAFLLNRARPDDVRGWLLRAVGRFRLGRKVASHAVMALSGGMDLLRAPLLARMMVMSLAARTCDGLCLTWAAWAFGIALPPLAGIFALNSSGAIGGLSMLPGGVAVVETSMSGILTLFGAPTAAALMATLVARFLTFWGWVAFGLVLLVWGLSRGFAPLREETAVGGRPHDRRN